MLEKFNELNEQTGKEKDLSELTTETKKNLYSFSQTILKQGGSKSNPDIPPSDDTNPDDINTETKEKKISVTKGLTAIETAIENEGDLRVRTYANVGLAFPISKKERVQLGYSGLNEFTNSLKGYFGKHVPSIGLKGLDFKAIGIIKTNKDGVIDHKYGLRYLVQKKGVDYGRIDVAGGENGASLTFFGGKNLGKKGTNVELLTDIQYDGKNKKILAPYTELQLNQEISKGFKVFMRGEIPGINYKGGTYLLGVSKSF